MIDYLEGSGLGMEPDANGNSNDLLTVAEAAKVFHPTAVKPATVRAAINRGDLPARRFGRTLLILRSDLENYRRTGDPRILAGSSGPRSDQKAPPQKNRIHQPNSQNSGDSGGIQKKELSESALRVLEMCRPKRR